MDQLPPSAYNLTSDTWRPYQYDTIQRVCSTGRDQTGIYLPFINEAPTGCHAKGQLIRMADGTLKAVENIKIDDKVMCIDKSDKGNSVTRLYRGVDTMYRVMPLRLTDFAPQPAKSFIVNADHILTFRTGHHSMHMIDMSVYDFLLLFGTQRQGTELICVDNKRTPLPFQLEYIGLGEYFGFALANDPHYLLDSGIITHNSGKSMVALAAGYGNRQTVVLTKTRALQHQYEVSYPSCQVLYGRNNYPCIHPDTPPNADMTAQDCRYEKPRDCEYFGACPYHVTKTQAMDAKRAVLNYAYWMITHKKWQPEFLVLDEAHNVSDVILEHVGTSINEHQRTIWGLPPFPLIESTTTSGLLRAQDYIAPDEAAAMWLNDAAGIMNQKVNTLRRVIEHGAHVTTKLLYQKRAAENLAHKLDTCLGAVEANPGDHWYIRSGPGVEYYQGQLVPGFLCKPLTARFDFQEFFATSPVRQVLIMSATIGQPETFAAELGLTDYTFYRTPAVWPPETRPVHILDVPSMGYAATKKDPTIFDQQADAIAKAIKQLPDTWSGIILVSRKSEATLLANRLRARGLANRMWVPPGAENGEYKPTNEQIMAWEEQLRYRPNIIAVAWSFWEGVDAKDSQILIAAKVPFHPRSSEFEMAREQYDHSFASQRVAWLLEQGLGRVRRGDPSDYNDPKQGIIRTYVAIADGSWTRIKKYLSQSMLDSLVLN